MSPYIFVYGTLKRAFSYPMASKLHQHATFVCEATTTGEMHLVRSHFNFPAGIYLNDVDTLIHGEVFKINENSVGPVLMALDSYEGDEYDRLLIDIKGNDGQTYECWMYSYIKDPSLFPRITSGRFD